MISLIVISGRSGSGKSTALNVLEDMGYYCIDNLPVTLLSPLVDRLFTDDDINNNNKPICEKKKLDLPACLFCFARYN